jgi:hypothetical protein
MRVARHAAKTLVTGLLGASLLVTAAPPASAGHAPGVTTRVDVTYLGLADYSVSADTVQPLVAPGFAVRPCFGGGSGQADVVAVVAEETYLDLDRVPAQPVRSLSLLTCADPPPGYARRDANEPPWYRLRAWADSARFRTFLERQNFAAQPATVSFTGSAHAFSFRATEPSGAVLAEGTFATPGVPSPPLASCAPALAVGRLISVSTRGASALDWDKTEATCLGASSLRWDATSPLAQLLGSGNQALFSFVTDVQQATYTFRRQVP